MTAFACAVLYVVLTGAYPGFIPPPQGVGDEILPLNARSFAMGGISAGLEGDTRFSLLNPAASAWTLSSGVNFGGRYSVGDVDAWSDRLGFPDASILVPLPWGIVLSGAIEGRSRLSEEDYLSFPEYNGHYEWSGGLAESYAGFSLRATDWLAVSLGGRCTFGNIVADVTLAPVDPEPPIPVNTVYRDDASLRQAWGGVLGVMVNTSGFDLGFSVSTDREGDIEVFRDYSGHGEDSLSQKYSIPGELTAGISFRPVPRLLLGADIYSRKALNILESRTDAGTVFSAGIEYDIGLGLTARAGYSLMSGLWRDGATSLRAGAGYSFSDGRAGVDLAAGYQYWKNELDAEMDETVLIVSFWATERWLGD